MCFLFVCDMTSIECLRMKKNPELIDLCTILNEIISIHDLLHKTKLLEAFFWKKTLIVQQKSRK